MKFLTTIFLLAFSIISNAQTKDTLYTVYGKVVDKKVEITKVAENNTTKVTEVKTFDYDALVKDIEKMQSDTAAWVKKWNEILTLESQIALEKYSIQKLFNVTLTRLSEFDRLKLELK